MQQCCTQSKRPSSKHPPSAARSAASQPVDLLLRRTLRDPLQSAYSQVTSQPDAPRVTVIEREWHGYMARMWHAHGSLPVKYLRCLKSSLADQRFDAILHVLELVRRHVFPHSSDDGLRGAYHLLKQLPRRQRLPGCPIIGNSDFDYHDRSLGGSPGSLGQTRHPYRTAGNARRLGSETACCSGEPRRVRSVLPTGARSCRGRSQSGVARSAIRRT